MNFIHEDFLLQSKTAQRLYHEFAAPQPILDYHSHLPSADVAANRRFADLFEIWLEGDHYKWRAMRANGVDERFCTGDASPREKFQAWARTVPMTLRNPLYHWTHLELKRYFNIDESLGEYTAESIWDRSKVMLQEDDLSAQGILRKFNVRICCTTDDPCDTLDHHRSVNASELGFRMYPTFRPDKALLVDQPAAFNQWLDALEATSNVSIVSLSHLLDALRQRHTFFHDSGARLSDHGLPHCYSKPCTQAEAASIFAKARSGVAASVNEHAQFASFMMIFFGFLDAQRGWTKQLHLGALRGNSTRGLREIGPDSGFDSIGDWPQADALGQYLDRLEQEKALPKIVVYNHNPTDNYVVATMVGNFQDGSMAGKVQFGSAWWFLDQQEAMKWQMNALSNCGLISTFIGMLTDSRSFLSYPRHEYFRRTLCGLFGDDIEAGLLPDDYELVGPVIREICFGNAQRFLGLKGV